MHLGDGPAVVVAAVGISLVIVVVLGKVAGWHCKLPLVPKLTSLFTKQTGLHLMEEDVEADPKWAGQGPGPLQHAFSLQVINGESEILSQADAVRRDYESVHGDDGIPTMATGIIDDTSQATAQVVTVTPSGVSAHTPLPIEIQTVLPRTQINTSDIQLEEVIGRGAYGKVFRGRWRGAPVAVKSISFNKDDRGALQQSQWEAVLSEHLRHPNVVQTFAWTVHSGIEEKADVDELAFVEQALSQTKLCEATLTEGMKSNSGSSATSNGAGTRGDLNMENIMSVSARSETYAGPSDSVNEPCQPLTRARDRSVEVYRGNVPPPLLQGGTSNFVQCIAASAMTETPRSCVKEHSDHIGCANIPPDCATQEKSANAAQISVFAHAEGPAFHNFDIEKRADFRLDGNLNNLTSLPSRTFTLSGAMSDSNAFFGSIPGSGFEAFPVIPANSQGFDSATLQQSGGTCQPDFINTVPSNSETVPASRTLVTAQSCIPHDPKEKQRWDQDTAQADSLSDTPLEGTPPVDNDFKISALRGRESCSGDTMAATSVATFNSAEYQQLPHPRAATARKLVFEDRSGAHVEAKHPVAGPPLDHGAMRVPSGQETEARERSDVTEPSGAEVAEAPASFGSDSSECLSVGSNGLPRIRIKRDRVSHESFVGHRARCQPRKLEALQSNSYASLPKPSSLCPDSPEFAHSPCGDTLKPLHAVSTSHYHHQDPRSQKISADGSEASFNSDEGFGLPHLAHRKSSSASVLKVISSPEEATTAVVLVVMEFCDVGSLHRAIQKKSFKPHGPWGFQLTYRALLRTAQEVAKGMEYIHSKGIVHGDLKPGNVLLKTHKIDRRGYVAKVSDFGLSVHHSMQRDTGSNNELLGTIAYTAPEVLLDPSNLQMASDVYAFGLMMWEMYHCQPVYEGLIEAQIFHGVLEGSLRPEWESGTPSDFQSLASACWNQQPERRPSFQEVINDLFLIEVKFRKECYRNKSPSPAKVQPRKPLECLPTSPLAFAGASPHDSTLAASLM
eukprot:jgi/Botrbrau1/18600/Bobra.0367s0041.2